MFLRIPNDLTELRRVLMALLTGAENLIGADLSERLHGLLASTNDGLVVLDLVLGLVDLLFSEESRHVMRWLR